MLFASQSFSRSTQPSIHAVIGSSSAEPREHFGCGCFESSYELARGAQVEEDLSLEEFELWVLVADRRAARSQRGVAA